MYDLLLRFICLDHDKLRLKKALFCHQTTFQLSNFPTHILPIASRTQPSTAIRCYNSFIGGSISCMSAECRLFHSIFKVNVGLPSLHLRAYQTVYIKCINVLSFFCNQSKLDCLWALYHRLLCLELTQNMLSHQLTQLTGIHMDKLFSLLEFSPPGNPESVFYVFAE